MFAISIYRVLHAHVEKLALSLAYAMINFSCSAALREVHHTQASKQFILDTVWMIEVGSRTL